MFKNILVPLDGSATAEAVLPFVQEIASRSGAQIVLTTAVQSVGVWDATMDSQILNREEETAVQYLASKAEGITAGPAKVRVVRGDAADCILRVAADEKADLIAISTHGRSGLSRWLFGSVATKVLEGAETPVLFLRPKEGEDKGAPGPVVHKILVPLDGSESAVEALPVIEDFAKTMGASLVLFHTVAPIAAYPGFEAAGAAAIGNVVEDLQAQAKAILSRTAEEVRSRGIEVSTAIVLDTAVEGIIRAADELKVDLIAIGTHGRGGLGRMVLGSVADGVVRRGADLPCLVIRTSAATS